ncbi:cyclic GMP-AMP synthase DncV-like nucleotidyltransferase [Pseudofrankia sp. DC12]|uniref:SMODS domain-containing nucleotidyltransferase n=1 Tax=Pseudofrankia sp. DC12 TaxID=683315 RepID=UPI0005F81558|nr:nucleotidyltransferase [Pseudofrankia sp. DC12]
MKHTDYFNNFLKNTVNLSQFNLDVLAGRVDAIYTALEADPELGPRLVKKIPQGSWAQKTIISPQNGKPFDADFLLQMNEVPDWSDNVQEYSNAVWKVIHHHWRYGAMPHSRKCRCVYVEYADNEMHVDIVPYVILADGRQVIVNRDLNQFETTNPDGFTTWMKDKDKIADGNLRKVIRLLKFLRDHKNSFTGTKSILITTLLGTQVAAWKKIGDPGYYQDLPTALLNLVSDLDVWLQVHHTKPSIADPSNPVVTFDHRWDETTYSYFRTRIHAHAAEIREAYHETDEEKSVKKWQDLFGDKFQAAQTSSASSKFGTAGAAGRITGGAEPPGISSSGRSGRAG